MCGEEEFDVFDDELDKLRDDFEVVEEVEDVEVLRRRDVVLFEEEDKDTRCSCGGEIGVDCSAPILNVVLLTRF